MTTRFKTSLAAALAVVTIATAAPMLMAQDQPQRRQGPGLGGPPPGGPGGPGMRRGGPMGFGPGFRELDLTDDQKAQLKSIADSHRAEFEAAGEKIGAAREGMGRSSRATRSTKARFARRARRSRRPRPT